MKRNSRRGGKSMEDYRILNAGDGAVCVEFGQQIDDAVNARVNGLYQKLFSHPIAGVTESIPTFRSLLVCYDPLRIRYGKLIRLLKKYAADIPDVVEGEKHVVEIPVCYEAEYAPDMGHVTSHTGLSAEEVIALHCGRDYRIHMLGFLPGFPYLGGMDERLATPRLKSPRTRIEAGSVGIGGSQTGIYPLPSPGGWQLIGRTPLKLYDPQRDKPVLYKAGDYIRFVQISKEQFLQMEKDMQRKEGV